MRAYILVTGLAFALLALAHLARIFEEGTRLLGAPVFLLTTVASVGIGVWAFILLRKHPRT